MAKETTYMASKPRYEILDGLRGVAALTVLIFHCFEPYRTAFGTQIINHGYLAVDFFFVLSGFVIGYAYDDRWDRMTTWSFFKRRLVRLHPLVIFGTIFGACMFFFEGSGYFYLIDGCPGWKFALVFVMALLMIPCGPGIDIRSWSEFNPFNGPNWSLTFEYIGNILYALLFRHLPTFVLGILCIASAFLTLNLTLGLDLFGVFEAPKFDVIGGWSLTTNHLFIGFTRFFYPFFCGLVIARLLASRRNEENPSGSPLSVKGGFWWCSLILVAIFSIPMISGEAGFADGLYQAISIVAIFPIVVLLGAGSRITDPRSAKVCKTLGDLSYPLYITHYPFMYLQMSWIYEHPDAPVWMHIVMNAGVVIMSIFLAWAALKLYDEPVRKWLTEHWLKRRSA